MESPVTGRYIPQNSKKRVFPGSSSSIEGKLEVNRNLKRKNKRSDRNEDAEEYHLMNKIHSSVEAESRKKGKGIISSALGVIEVDSDSDDGVSNSYNRKNYMDFYADDYIYDDEDEYAILQSHFDDIDLPTGIEVSLPVPGFFDSSIKINKMTHPNHSRAKSSLMGSPNFHSASHHKHKMEKGKHASLNSCSASRQLLKPRLHKMGSGSGASGSHNRHGQLGRKVSGSNSNTQVGGQAVGVEVNELVGEPENGQIVPMEDVKLDQDCGGVAGSSSGIRKLENGDDVLRNDRKFKKFDIVKDHSGHHFEANNSSMMEPLRNWAKKIQKEWRILKKNLPDTIFVRVYESRMDLLRAVIIGAEGTPYHDGLFFFDICFPSNYPDSPPEVYYHSGGLRINPNLYHTGKVCLSLLNTWSGRSNEKWIPGASTMLQVLVSIQGLILNAKPYFNEPGYERSSGSVNGEKHSLKYNKQTLVLSLKTMVYTMKKPPQYFEDLVIDHFRGRAHAILTTCKAYCEGVQVGCVVDKSKAEVEGCSRWFKKDVLKCMKMLVVEFEKIGVEDIKKFLEQGGGGVKDMEAGPSLTRKKFLEQGGGGAAKDTEAGPSLTRKKFLEQGGGGTKDMEVGPSWTQKKFLEQGGGGGVKHTKAGPSLTQKKFLEQGGGEGAKDTEVGPSLTQKIRAFFGI